VEGPGLDELPVLEHDERAYLALTLAIRYGAAYDNPMVTPIIGLLTSEDRHDAALLGSALRLGYAITGGAHDLLDLAFYSNDEFVPKGFGLVVEGFIMKQLQKV